MLTVESLASAAGIRPALSKLIANGTAPAESLTTARRAGRPSRATGKTSTVLADLVVTTSSRPPGVNATWPGELLNSGTLLLSGSSEQCASERGAGPAAVRRKPWTLPAPPAFMT